MRESKRERKREGEKCGGEHRINNDLKEPHSKTDKKTNTSVSVGGVFSECLNVAVLCSPT